MTYFFERNDILMALALKKKKEESTNEKIVRLFQEGKTVEEICTETELRNDIVVGVIRRRLGEESIPETVITAKPKEAQPEEENAENVGEEDYDGLSKLERYMLEKKKKQEEAPAAEDGHMVSLVEDYKKQTNAAEEAVQMSSSSEMEEISIESIKAEPLMPEESKAEEPVKMDSVSEEAYDAPAEDISANDENSGDKTGKAFSKMKAFALSQIEANNVKIAGLEQKSAQLETDYAPKLDEANAALTASQANFEAADAKYSETCAETEKAREEHRAALAKADEEYRRKLEEIDAEYKKATSDANEKLQASEDAAREVLDKLDSEKNAAQEDLFAKQEAVNELRAKIDSDSEELAKQIKALKDENNGYQDFLV